MVTPRPTHDAPRRLRTTLALLVRRFSLAERADVECCGLTVSQAATLEALARCGPLRQGDLCLALGIQASTLTRNLERLEQRNLIERRRDPDDGRAWQVGLTRPGRTAAARVVRQEDRFAEQILTQLEPAVATRLLDDLDQLMAAIRVATDDCCPGAFDHLWSGDGSQGGCDVPTGTDCSC